MLVHRCAATTVLWKTCMVYKWQIHTGSLRTLTARRHALVGGAGSCLVCSGNGIGCASIFSLLPEVRSIAGLVYGLKAEFTHSCTFSHVEVLAAGRIAAERWAQPGLFHACLGTTAPFCGYLC